MTKLVASILCMVALTANCQIKSIVVEVQQFDEPPTKQGKTKYSIEFKTNKVGDLEASFFTEGRKRRHVKPIFIEKSKLDTVEKWLARRKREFKLSEFDFEEDKHLWYLNNSQYKLNFLTQGNILVQTDSFAFCQSNRILQRTMIGGFLSTIAMELNGNLKDSFKFESGDIGENTFDLLNYLYAYKLLKDKLPDKFPKARLFTEDSFKNNIAYYLQTIECEDYYYKEFVKLHPERTAKQNRMWDGWDYKQFLKYRGINK